MEGVKFPERDKAPVIDSGKFLMSVQLEIFLQNYPSLMRQLTICQQGSAAKYLCHLAQFAKALCKTCVSLICKTIGIMTVAWGFPQTCYQDEIYVDKAWSPDGVAL
jgi:hypothetical protein